MKTFSMVRKLAVSGLATTFLTLGTTAPIPAYAAPDCEAEAIIRCETHWSEGRLPQYASMDDCYTGEVALGNCFPVVPECPSPTYIGGVRFCS